MSTCNNLPTRNWGVTFIVSIFSCPFIRTTDPKQSVRVGYIGVCTIELSFLPDESSLFVSKQEETNLTSSLRVITLSKSDEKVQF